MSFIIVAVSVVLRACRSLENNLGVSKFESQSWQPALKIETSWSKWEEIR
jgi:hypothetical protein